MNNSTWQETKLYQALNTRKGDTSEEIRTLLKSNTVMNAIELVLDKSNTTPKDFTLHDSSHSFRVAEQMWEIIPDATRKILSEYELLILIMSAYLHDIGMSPSFNKVQNHLLYLSSSEKDILDEDEIDDFQKWIDNNENLKSRDIRNDIIADQNEINYIMSYYIRDRHNDWGGEWIKEHFAPILLSEYPSWLNDLIKVCKSHHYGLEKLIGDEYNPVFIGKSVVHLRYLAMCLRIADVIENDPERTPEVILKHRSILPSSEKYWIKDHYFSLYREGNFFTIHARPEKAYIHKAIEETADYIADELRLCRQLITEKPLEYSTFGKLKNYTWLLESSVNKDIREKDGMYEYIQGAFRPNTSKLLELLGGNQIYGDPIWAIRELLQNSFDAVKEKIAYQIINEEKNPNLFIDKFGEFNDIFLRIEKKPDGLWLICKDSGVGMTKKIIINYFLESGSSKRHEISELERRCRSNGFNFGRTGQFGIGVLSYFMIADKVLINTKRVQNTGYDDSELFGWSFEINGIHDFGELRPLRKAQAGTEIQLKLKKEFEENIEEWNTNVRNFIKQYISRSPCNLEYESYLSEDNKLNVSCGWVISSPEVKNMVANGFVNAAYQKDGIDPLASLLEQEEYEASNNMAREAYPEMRQVMDFLYQEGELPNRLGKYRLHVPYFKLNYGNSFVYMREEVEKSGHYISKINDGFYYLPEFSRIYYSLKGFDINIEAKDNYSNKNQYVSSSVTNAFIELDIEENNNSTLVVSRHKLMVDKSFSVITDFINKEVSMLIEANKEKFDNIYGSLNKLISGLNLNNNYWPFLQPDQLNAKGEERRLKWDKIKFPLSRSRYPLVPINDDDQFPKFNYSGQTLTLIKEIHSYNRKVKFDWLSNNCNHFEIGLIMPNDKVQPMNSMTRCLVVSNNSYNKKVKLNSYFKSIELPKIWSNILLFQVEDYAYDGVYINYHGIIYKNFDESIYEEIVSKGISAVDLEIVIQSKKHAAAFLLLCLTTYPNEKWKGLCERRSEQIGKVFSLLNLKQFYILNTSSIIKIGIGEWTEFSHKLLGSILENKIEGLKYCIHRIDK